MNRQLSKLWLVALLATGVLASCDKDRFQEPSSPAEKQGEVVTLSLSAEVSLEEEVQTDDELKGLDFKVEQVGSKRIPRPQITTATVPVHTILKNSTGTVTLAKTLNWEYRAKDRTLLLRQTSANSFMVTNFNNNNNVKWYIAGLFAHGTTLNETNKTVTLSGIRALRGVSGNVGEVVGNFSVPYWTGWMELKMETNRGTDASGFKYATPASPGILKPLGTLIRYRLGNKLKLGQTPHSFTPESFTVRSNSFSDKGTFDFAASTVPATNPQSALPKWTETKEEMVYTFAAGSAPGTLAYNTSASKVYYAWVMPYAA